MANKVEPRKVALLAVLVVALVGTVIYEMRPGIVQGGSSIKSAATKVGTYTVPELGWDRESGRELPKPETGRNLFTFGAPPTPTPDPRPTPTPVPTLPPRPIVLPTPETVIGTSGERLPPPPAFPLTYMGWLGPNRLPIAVFRDGDNVLAAPVGDKLQNRFVIRKVNPDAVVIGFVGYPDSITTSVPLSRKE